MKIHQSRILFVLALFSLGAVSLEAKKTVIPANGKPPGGWQSNASMEIDTKGQPVLKFSGDKWSAATMNFASFWAGNELVTDVSSGRYSELVIVFTVAKGSKGLNPLAVSLGDVAKGTSQQLRFQDYMDGRIRPGEKHTVRFPLKDFTKDTDKLKSSRIWDVRIIHPFGEKQIEMTIHEVSFTK